MAAAETIARALQGRKSGSGWIAPCPVHDDRRPSLSITDAKGGKVLVHCHAGCDQIAVIGELTARGLWPEGEDAALCRSSPAKCKTARQEVAAGGVDDRSSGPTAGLTLEAYADAKGLDPAFLKTLGVTEQAGGFGPGKYVRIPYFDVDGEVIAVRQRHALEGPNKFRWKKGAKPCLYGLDRLEEARARGFVMICEGESDAQTLWQTDFPALGLPGAANWREERDARPLAEIETIYIVDEGDQGSKAIRDWLAKSSIRDRVRLVQFAAPVKDPSALYLHDPEGFRAAMEAKLAAAAPWAEIEAKRRSEEEAAALGECREIADAENILALLEESLAERGLVGEDRNACILYLALTSRLLESPVNVAVKGPSSGGKSFVVDCVLEHFPSEAFIFTSGMSERALIYMDEPIAHRHLVVAEAAGTAGDMQDYLVRTLLSEGKLSWRTTDKTTTDGLQPRVIEKEGPTGLIVTTTRVTLHPENETRILSLRANDTREQTRAVLHAIAQRNGAAKSNCDIWKALQIWLARGECRVVIPYAVPLADLASADAVRMRRDFRALLSLVEAHALLHRATRRRDSSGQIVAEIKDYVAVRNLVADLMAEGNASTVSKTVRETVAAVAELTRDGDTASVRGIAENLGLDRSATSRRCTEAAKAGYIVNEQEKRGSAARYRLGEPMPEDKPILPTPEELREAHAREGGGGTDDPKSNCITATAAQEQGGQLCSHAVGIETMDHPPPPGAARRDELSIAEQEA